VDDRFRSRSEIPPSHDEVEEFPGDVDDLAWLLAVQPFADARRGGGGGPRISLGGGGGEPIRNPVTGEEHRARIDLPHGFEYELAEVGSASSRTTGKLAFELKDSYAQFARLHMNNKGPVRHRTAA